MKLPVIDPLTYISPTSFMQHELCPLKLYLLKLAGLEKIRIPTSKPAAIGLFFEAYVKDWIKKQREETSSHIHLAREVSKIKCEDKDECIAIAKNIATEYIKQGCAERLLKAKTLKMQQTLYRLRDPDICGALWVPVPLLGRLDADPDDTVFDWKTRGFANPTSPIPGYNKRIHFIHGAQPPHPKQNTFPATREDWAIQIVFYNWLLGKDTYEYIIHELCNTQSGIIWLEHEGTITESFADDLWKRVVKMWENINGLEAEISIPEPAQWRCEKYNTICEASVHCSKYQETLGDRDQRKFHTK